MNIYSKDPDIIALVEGTTIPDLESIRQIAIKRNIKSASDFWDLFDKVILMWKENKALNY